MDKFSYHVPPIFNQTEIMIFRRILLINTILTLVSTAVFAYDYPKSREEQIYDEMGSLAGENGISFTPGHIRKEETKSLDKNWKRINKYLWEAAGKVLSFMPILNMDASHGIIVTDWYSTTKEPSYSFKIQVNISLNVISAEALEVKVFERRLKNGQWYNEPVSTTLANKFEDQIIREARELYIKSQSK